MTIMPSEIPNIPVVCCFSGHDPTGGAGMQADIETLNALGCHACGVITALTEQDTRNVQRIWPQPATTFLAQAERLLADLPVSAFKIGLLGDAALAETVAALLRKFPEIPVVFDPVLAAGGGHSVADADLRRVMTERLMPLTTVLTPNTHEARALAALDDGNEDAWARALCDLGCRYVLLSGGHTTTPAVINCLYRHGQLVQRLVWPRLPHQYHGSGCTLASALAAGLAQGLTLEAASERAQRYTWETLHATTLRGRGQYLPRRFAFSESNHNDTT